MRKKSPLHEERLYQIHETDKAYLVGVDQFDEGVWIPKSRCERADESRTQVAGELPSYLFTMDEQIAIEKHLV